MSIFAGTVAAFGRRLGLEGLAPGRSGGVELSIERVGRLQMEEGDGCALVTLARPRPPHASRAARTALTLCHWRENHPWPVHAGLKGTEWLSLTARVPLEEFDAPAAERVVGCLSGLLDSVEGAG